MQFVLRVVVRWLIQQQHLPAHSQQRCGAQPTKELDKGGFFFAGRLILESGFAMRLGKRCLIGGHPHGFARLSFRSGPQPTLLLDWAMARNQPWVSYLIASPGSRSPWCFVGPGSPGTRGPSKVLLNKLGFGVCVCVTCVCWSMWHMKWEGKLPGPPLWRCHPMPPPSSVPGRALVHSFPPRVCV